MSGLLMGRIWYMETSGHERDILLAMADHAHDDGASCYPSVPLIAWKVGVTDRTVQRIIAGLVTRGVLVLVKASSRHRANEYRIDLSRLTAKAPLPRGDKMPHAESPGVTFGDLGVTSEALGVTSLVSPEPINQSIEPNTSATAAEQVAAKKGGGAAGQPKARKARDPGTWAAFRDQALTDYGQPSTVPTQALVTRIVKTAEYHGLDPGRAAMAWGRWRAETLANGTAKYHPLHLAAQSWGEWLAARKLAHEARLARAESREVNT